MLGLEITEHPPCRPTWSGYHRLYARADSRRTTPKPPSMTTLCTVTHDARLFKYSYSTLNFPPSVWFLNRFSLSSIFRLPLDYSTSTPFFDLRSIVPPSLDRPTFARLFRLCSILRPPLDRSTIDRSYHFRLIVQPLLSLYHLCSIVRPPLDRSTLAQTEGGRFE